MLYCQILDYLNLFIQKNTQLVKKGQKNGESEDRDIKIEKLIEKKDLKGSLKFIDLEEPEPDKKEKFRQAWMKIPQFTTNYDLAGTKQNISLDIKLLEINKEENVIEQKK